MICNKSFQRSLISLTGVTTHHLSEDNVSKSDWAAGEKQDFVLLLCFVAMLKTYFLSCGEQMFIDFVCEVAVRAVQLILLNKIHEQVLKGCEKDLLLIGILVHESPIGLLHKI